MQKLEIDQQDTTQQAIIDFFLSNGILLSEDILSKVDNSNFDFIKREINQRLIDNDYSKLDENNILNLINSINSSNKKIELTPIQNLISQSKDNDKLLKKYNVKVVYTYRDFNKKREIKDFVTYFNHRYQALSSILRNRDLPSLISINKLYENNSSETLSIIGMVYDIKITKNGHYILEVEDPTGKTKVLINKKREDLYGVAKDIVRDEVLAITGVKGEDIFFANNIVFPDVALNKEFKKAKDFVSAAFVSDLQIGSKDFQEEDFKKFLRWLHGETGNTEQKKLGRSVKYLFIVGDIVDGIGVFPGQEKELTIMDAYKQYEKAAEILKGVPEDVQMIIIPGNHDPMRLSDPQPIISKEYGKALYEVPNLTFVSSPGIVNIHSSETFSGFDVLMYHGFSIFYYADKVEKLRESGGGDRADLVMKFLLQKRHLAPTHTSNLYIPDIRGDPMVIDKVPDILVSGHTHRACANTYRNVNIISCSCWDGISEYALKFGGHPLPGRVPVINLQTREVKILKFCD